MIDLVEIFDRYSEEHNKFELVDDKPSSRPDLCAFVLLDRLLPGSEDRIISASDTDEIYLDVDCDSLAEVATESDILTLIRCGVMHNEYTDCLSMFV